MSKILPSLQIFGIANIPIVKSGDNIIAIILNSMNQQRFRLQNGDIIVISHTIISKAEDSVVKLSEVKPSLRAKIISEKIRKPPEIVEVILRESRHIIRMRDRHLITQNKRGLICANAGVDLSNVSGGDSVALLPKDPDGAAEHIMREIQNRTGKNVAIIISDTSGRPLRVGQVNIAIGIAGINPLFDRKGEKDLFGYTLQVKLIAIADEIASAAELVIGEADESMPIAIVRGFKYDPKDNVEISRLHRSSKIDLFV